MAVLGRIELTQGNEISLWIAAFPSLHGTELLIRPPVSADAASSQFSFTLTCAGLHRHSLCHNNVI